MLKKIRAWYLSGISHAATEAHLRAQTPKPKPSNQTATALTHPANPAARSS